jgi:hypothetical protein
MPWERMLAYITGSVNEDLVLCENSFASSRHALRIIIIIMVE